MIKLIASDMDGTLLNHQMQVPQANIEAIKKAQAAGIEFIAATGRGIEHAKAALDVANIHVPMILLNGARVVDEHGKTVLAVPIPLEKAFHILDLLDEHHIYYEIFTDEHVYSEDQAFRIDLFADRINELVPDLSAKQAIAATSSELDKLPITYVSNMREQIRDKQEEVLKIIAFDKAGPKVLHPVSEKLSSLGELSITASEPTNLEINHENAQKGIALANYAKKRGLTAENVMAIGDNFNDVSMLTYAKTSFAMGNAAEKVKEYATYLTKTNEENGVALAIDQILAQQ